VTYYRRVRAFSYFELMLFTALLVVWIGELDPELKTALGWAHGFGWIGLCLLVANGCVRGIFPWPLLAATVSPAGPLGSSIGFVVLDRHLESGGRRSRPVTRAGRSQDSQDAGRDAPRS
jgi:hypothetical protein